MWVNLQLSVLLENEAIVFETAVTPAKNFHLIVPLVVTIKYGLDEVWLSIGDVQEEPIVFQDSLHLISLTCVLIASRRISQVTYLLHVSSAVFQCLFWRTPRATEDHSIERALVKSNVDAAGLNVRPEGASSSSIQPRQESSLDRTSP